MSDFATPARPFVSTAGGLLVTVTLSPVPHQPQALGSGYLQAIASPRPFLASREDEPAPNSTTDLTILVSPLGEVTTPDFYGITTPDHLGGRWGNIRRLLDTAQPLGIKLPSFPGLAAWIDADGEYLGRNANMTASMLIRAQCSAPRSLVYGPLLITGGMPQHPVGLDIEQVFEVLEDLLDIDLDDDRDWGLGDF
jgi:hypothetical protein